MKDTLDSTNITTKKESSAYVGTDSVSISKLIPDQELIITIWFFNSGETPADSVEPFVDVTLGNSTRAISIQNRYLPEAIPQHTERREFDVPTGFFPTREDSINIRNGSLLLGVSMNASYKDVFNQVNPLGLCMKYSAKSKRFESWITYTNKKTKLDNRFQPSN